MGYRCGRYRTLTSVSVRVRDSGWVTGVVGIVLLTSVSASVRGSGWVTGVVGIVPLPLCLCVFETVDGLPVW